MRSPHLIPRQGEFSERAVLFTGMIQRLEIAIPRKSLLISAVKMAYSNCPPFFHSQAAGMANIPAVFQVLEVRQR